MHSIWHVVLTYEGWETQVAEAFVKKLGLETFCPRARCFEERFNRRVEVLRPLVSRYVFVQFDGRDPHVWGDVRYTAGVYHIIGGDDPSPIPAKDLEYWFSQADANGVVEMPEVKVVMYEAGDCVVLKDGPFVDRPARCTWLDKRGARVIAKVFGGQVEMFVPHGFLRKATRAEAEAARLLKPSLRLPVNKFLGKGNLGLYAAAGSA